MTASSIPGRIEAAFSALVKRSIHTMPGLRPADLAKRKGWPVATDDGAKPMLKWVKKTIGKDRVISFGMLLGSIPDEPIAERTRSLTRPDHLLQNADAGKSWP